MTPRRLVISATAAIAAITALSCGEVPTLPDGIAFISTIVAPATAVVAGDSLRDTLGEIAPLRVFSISRAGDTIGRLATRYLVTSIDAGVRIDSATGILVVSDSLRSIRLIAQVGNQLQTPELALPVVRQPDALRANRALVDTLMPDAAAQDIRTDFLAVTASNQSGATPVGVEGVVVHYAISRLAPASVTHDYPDSVVALVDESNRLVPSTGGRASSDTTDGSGVAQRRLRVTFRAFPNLPHIDSVEVTVTARNFRGVPLAGSPLVFLVVNPK